MGSPVKLGGWLGGLLALDLDDAVDHEEQARPDDAHQHEANADLVIGKVRHGVSLFE